MHTRKERRYCDRHGCDCEEHGFHGRVLQFAINVKYYLHKSKFTRQYYGISSTGMKFRAGEAGEAGESAPHVVGHFGGNLHRELDQPAYLARPAPDGLVDQFAYAPLFDRIDVFAALGEQTGDDAARAFVVAGDQRAAPLC